MTASNPPAASVLDVLQQTRELLSDKSRWTRRDYAKTADGQSVYGSDPNACRWCLVGALDKFASATPALWSGTRDALSDCTSEVDRHGRRVSLTWVNDELGHRRVMSLLDCAISRVQAQA